MNIGIGGVVIPEAKKITMSMRDMVKRYKQIAYAWGTSQDALAVVGW